MGLQIFDEIIVGVEVRKRKTLIKALLRRLQLLGFVEASHMLVPLGLLQEEVRGCENALHTQQLAHVLGGDGGDLEGALHRMGSLGLCLIRQGEPDLQVTPNTVIGQFKDEASGKPITDFVELRRKCTRS